MSGIAENTRARTIAAVAGGLVALAAPTASFAQAAAAAADTAIADPGTVTCPDFVAASKQGSAAPGMAPFRQYLAGFDLGYAWQAPAPFDVFGTLGDPPVDAALDAIAAWCAGNGQARFADGLKAVVRRLRSAVPAH